jgi:thiamine biosynthesis lipoprotein
VTVGPLLAEAIAVAVRAAELTDGAVDPTVGPAVRALGYDRDFALMAGAAPSAPARPAGGRSAVAFDAASATVTLAPGVELDLGATAKALAADRAARAAATATGAAVLVNLGGDVAVAGPVPAGGWRVRVTDDHRAAASAPGQTVRIDAGALATSSTTVRRWGGPDRPIHHIVDPATGASAREVWRTVSVAAATCVDANTASTAAIVRGQDAPEWLAARALPARLVRVDGEVVTVGGWPAEDAA